MNFTGHWAINNESYHLIRNVFEEKISKLSHDSARGFFPDKSQSTVEDLETRDDETAIIPIKGVLVKDESEARILSFFFGDATSYEMIRKRLEKAEKDSYKRIILDIDSPGGMTSGLLAIMKTIHRMSGEMEVIAEFDDAFSAGYMIASQASKIHAKEIDSSTGSVGVMISFFSFFKSQIITNTESPEKNLELESNPGQIAERKVLDSIAETLYNQMAVGRKTSIARIKSEYGRGATFLAEEAKVRGMIDFIGNYEVKKNVISNVNSKKERKYEVENESIADIEARITKSILSAINAQKEEEKKAQQIKKSALEEEREKIISLFQMAGDSTEAIQAIKRGYGNNERHENIIASMQQAKFQEELKKTKGENEIDENSSDNAPPIATQSGGVKDIKPDPNPNEKSENLLTALFKKEAMEIKQEANSKINSQMANLVGKF